MTIAPPSVFTRTRLCDLFERTAKTDSAGLYQCAEGVRNLLEAAGLPHKRGHGYQWKDSLPEAGWVKLEGVRPQDAPPGAVIAYDRDPPATRKNNGAGSEYGHVEIAAINENGERVYISDASRKKPGGSVPHNFAGVFWHPKLGPPPTIANTQMAQIMAQADAKDPKKKPEVGSYDFLAQEKKLFETETSQINIGPISGSGTQADSFNTASNQTSLKILLSLLAVAAAGGLITGNNPLQGSPVKPS